LADRRLLFFFIHGLPPHPLLLYPWVATAAFGPTYRHCRNFPTSPTTRTTHYKGLLRHAAAGGLDPRGGIVVQHRVGEASFGCIGLNPLEGLSLQVYG
jgi:hypothetical protein